MRVEQGVTVILDTGSVTAKTQAQATDPLGTIKLSETASLNPFEDVGTLPEPTTESGLSLAQDYVLGPLGYVQNNLGVFQFKDADDFRVFTDSPAALRDAQAPVIAVTEPNDDVSDFNGTVKLSDDVSSDLGDNLREPSLIFDRSDLWALDDTLGTGAIEITDLSDWALADTPVSPLDAGVSAAPAATPKVVDSAVMHTVKLTDADYTAAEAEAEATAAAAPASEAEPFAFTDLSIYQSAELSTLDPGLSGGGLNIMTDLLAPDMGLSRQAGVEAEGPTALFEDLSSEPDFAVRDDGSVFQNLSVNDGSIARLINPSFTDNWLVPETMDFIDDMLLFVDDGQCHDLGVA